LCEDDLAETIKKLATIVLKPLDGNHGKELLSMLKLGRCGFWFGFAKNTANASL
jgi:hypothetical protein